jgi:hypothetical protein
MSPTSATEAPKRRVPEGSAAPFGRFAEALRSQPHADDIA